MSPHPTGFPRHPTVSYRLTMISWTRLFGIPITSHSILRYPTVYMFFGMPPTSQDITRYPTMYKAVSHRLPTVSYGIPPISHGIPRYLTDFPWYPTLSRRLPTVSHSIPPNPTAPPHLPTPSHGIPRFHGMFVDSDSNGSTELCRRAGDASHA